MPPSRFGEDATWDENELSYLPDIVGCRNLLATCDYTACVVAAALCRDSSSSTTCGGCVRLTVNCLRFQSFCRDKDDTQTQTVGNEMVGNRFTL